MFFKKWCNGGLASGLFGDGYVRLANERVRDGRVGTGTVNFQLRGGEPFLRHSALCSPQPALPLTPSFHRPARCAEVQAQGLIETQHVKDGIECTWFLQPDREGGLGSGVGFAARFPECGTRKRANEFLVLADKIITSPVASNCNLWAPCENTASLLLRKRLFSAMLRTEVWRGLAWPVSWRNWSLVASATESGKYFHCHTWLRRAPPSPRRKAGIYWAHWCQLPKEDVI